MLSQSNLFPINDLDPLIGPCGQSFTGKAPPSNTCIKIQRTDFLGSQMEQIHLALSKLLAIAPKPIRPPLLHWAVSPFYPMVFSLACPCLVWSSFRPCSSCCLNTTWSFRIYGVILSAVLKFHLLFYPLYKYFTHRFCVFSLNLIRILRRD